MTEPHTLNSRDWSFDTSPLVRDTPKALRLYPAAKPSSEVVHVFSRFGRDLQSFEVVSDNGKISIRPTLPDTARSAQTNQLMEDEMMRKAA